MFFKDPANIFVVCLMAAFIGFVAYVAWRSHNQGASKDQTK